MTQRLIVVLLLTLSAICAMGQKKGVAPNVKKDMAQARTYLKAGNNLDKAEQLMSNLLRDSANRQNERIWLLLFDAVKKQYDQGNEKLYLKQKYDTASLFNLTYKMFTVLQGLDTIDAQPVEGGKPRLQYRKRHADFLDAHRRNLFNGGLYFIKKQQFTRAYSFLDRYIDCAHHPMFAAFDYGKNDKQLPEAAYWAVYCGYKNQDSKATLHHTYYALKDTAHYSAMLQYLADTYLLDNDSARYEKALQEGFTKYPAEQFFFSRLVDYYGAQSNWKKLLETANLQLANDSNHLQAMVVKSSALLNTLKYQQCVTFTDSLLAVCDSLPDPYYNAGMACFYTAVSFDKKGRLNAKQRQQMLGLYKRSLKYLERYRELAPDEQRRWAMPLYTIYLNLNMGKEFDEINEIIRKNRL